MISVKRNDNDLDLVHGSGDREKMDLRDISEAKTDKTWYCIETGG